MAGAGQHNRAAPAGPAFGSVAAPAAADSPGFGTPDAESIGCQEETHDRLCFLFKNTVGGGGPPPPRSIAMSNQRRAPVTVRLQVESLDDRVVPSAAGLGGAHAALLHHASIAAHGHMNAALRHAV